MRSSNAWLVRKNSQSVILVGLIFSAAVFFSGCQCKKYSVQPDGGSVQYSQPKAGTPESSSVVQYRDSLAQPMVRLTSFELARADGEYSSYGQSATAFQFTPQGQTKWETLKLDLFELPQVTWDNTKAVVSKPENLLLLGVAGGFSIWGEFDFDERVDSQLRGRKIINKDWTIAAGTSGNPATHFALAAGIYAYGLLNDNNTAYDFGKTLTHALVLSGLATVSLKVVAWNHVPNGEMFGWPSGHTSSTMTVASVVHEYYGLLPAAPLYALTGMYERMITGEHWASDVIFGAAMGYVIGHTVAGRHRMQVFGMDIVPYNNPELGSSGIALIKSW
ncbi:MAG: phosphatase PAP2 family protein [Actinobacteria bacterium]|nr:phosphatase PAP2 family protein [Actinomycetota bacterium]